MCLQIQQLIIDPLKRGLKVGKPLLFLRDDRLRSASDETLVGKLTFRLCNLILEAGDFFLEPGPLGLDIDLDHQHQFEITHDLHRGPFGILAQ